MYFLILNHNILNANECRISTSSCYLNNMVVSYYHNSITKTLCNSVELYSNIMIKHRKKILIHSVCIQYC